MLKLLALSLTAQLTPKMLSILKVLEIILHILNWLSLEDTYDLLFSVKFVLIHAHFKANIDLKLVCLVMLH